MPRVVRRRRLDASPGRVWSVVSDPYHLPRWWPRTQRVENVTAGEGKGRKWTQVLETGDGGTEVTVESEQRLRGLSRLGGFMMRRAIGRTLSEALTGLERASGGTAEPA